MLPSDCTPSKKVNLLMVWHAAKWKGQKLGNYDLLELIGKGGMGSVYKARHRVTGGVVAIKTLAPEVADNPVLRQRFEREFRAARGLDHPHIVQALDFGQEGTTPYLVMEFVDGQSLGERLAATGPLPEAEAVTLGIPIALALYAAHQQGIIHRDVKPDNILLTAGGAAKLADLGLAKDLDTDLALTRTASVLGTPNFMPPEQFTDTKNVDFSCDIYALGATLYMAVTGVLPFKSRGHISTLKKKLCNEIAPPRQLVPTLSPRFDRALLRALRAERNQRPATCLEFIEECTGEPLPPSAVPEGGSPGQERRVAVRFPAQLESSCRSLRGGEQDRWKAIVRDVSAQGVGLWINRRFEPGTLLMIEMPGKSRGLIRLLLARVVQVQEERPQGWAVGCQLCRELSNDDILALMPPPETERTLSKKELQAMKRRAAVRYPCPPSLSGAVLLGTDTATLRAAVVNLSVGGVGLLLGRPLEPATSLLLQLTNQTGAVVGELSARVVHVREQARGDWLVGCAFTTALAPRDLQALLIGDGGWKSPRVGTR